MNNKIGSGMFYAKLKHWDDHMKQNGENLECMRKIGSLLTSIGAVLAILPSLPYLKDSLLLILGVILFVIGVVLLIKSRSR
jgi:uncharacterized membrane protein YjjP (DUF1212 family)